LIPTSVNARSEDYEYIELFGKPGLFTNSRIDRDTVPEGWYAYDLRGSDYDPGEPVTVESHVVVNHAGTILTHDPVTIPKEGFKRLRGRLDFSGYQLTLKDFCEERGLIYPEDNLKFKLRPASESEAGVFYAMTPEQDANLAVIGHVRMDFGHGGTEFWHTWHPRGEESLNTPEFKQELGEVVDMLRKTVLKDLSAMSRYCGEHGGQISGGCSQNYGYVVDTAHYRYCLRCNPVPGDYQAYLTCFDLDRQRLNLMQTVRQDIVGMTFYGDGNATSFTDADDYIEEIREELPYRASSGFRFETVTDDPAVRKAVDDLVYNEFGENNPRRVCNYGLTDTGKQKLKNAADPDLPHEYEWFVMTDASKPTEQLITGLTLKDAIDFYKAQELGDKRIGVTKDGIATVDFVVTMQGEEEYFSDYEKLASFKDDPVIHEAVETMHRELDAPEQTMTFGGM
jgi:hypothetical protein